MTNKKEIIFTTKLSVEECIKIIEQNYKNPLPTSWFENFFEADIAYHYEIKGDKLRLQKNVIQQSGFKPTFYGKFVRESNVTKLIGEFKYSTFDYIFPVIWYSFFVITGVGGLIALIIDSSNSEGDPVGLMSFTVLMPIFGYLIIRFLKNMGNEYMKQTIGFIERILEAKVKNTPDKVGTK